MNYTYVKQMNRKTSIWKEIEKVRCRRDRQTYICKESLNLNKLLNIFNFENICFFSQVWLKKITFHIPFSLHLIAHPSFPIYNNNDQIAPDEFQYPQVIFQSLLQSCHEKNAIYQCFYTLQELPERARFRTTSFYLLGNKAQLGQRAFLILQT